MIKRITMKWPPVIERVISWPIVEARSRARGRRGVAVSSTGPLQLFHAHPLVAVHRRRGWQGALKWRVKVRITKRRSHGMVRETVVVVVMVKFVKLSSPPKVVQFLQQLPLSATLRLRGDAPLSTLICKDKKIISNLEKNFHQSLTYLLKVASVPSVYHMQSWIRISLLRGPP